MQTTNAFVNDISAYPGTYKPIQFKLETLAFALSKSHHGMKNPPCNICESGEYYKVELAVPGLKRDDFFAEITHAGKLVISALHNEETSVSDNYKKHGFNYSCFSRKVTLPKNVDTDFVKAEFREGVLAFWFLKTQRPYKKTASVIVIY